MHCKIIFVIDFAANFRLLLKINSDRFPKFSIACKNRALPTFNKVILGNIFFFIYLINN